MVTLAQVKLWRPEDLHETAVAMQHRLVGFTHSGDDFGRVLPIENWVGAAADGAASTHSHLLTKLDTFAASVSFVIKGLKQAADAIPPVQRAIANMENLAQRYAFAVSDTGEVEDLLRGTRLPEDMHPQDRAEARQQISDGVGQALRVAEDIGHDLTVVLHHARDGEVPIGDGGTVTAAAEAGFGAIALTTPPPPEHGTPQQNAAWWTSLSGAERTATVADPVNRIGNLDGVPCEARSQANMRALPRIKVGLQHRIDELKGRIKNIDSTTPAGVYPGTTQATESAMNARTVQEIRQQINGLEHKLDALNRIGDTVTQSAGLPESRRCYLLGVDGDNSGKVILARGNPDTAHNVATFVPGTGSDLGGVPAGFSQRTDAMWTAAGGERTGTSVVFWQGYDAPPDILDAGSTSYAENGKNALNSFQQGLRETHHGAASHNVLIGHSYGSTLIGHAARDGHLATDDLVFVGSPGVGVDHANQLHVPSEHVFATEAVNDIIRLTNIDIGTGDGTPGVDVIHGPDPTSSDFGARTFSADQGTAGTLGGVSADAHSEYWQRRNPSLANLGRIIRGGQPV